MTRVARLAIASIDSPRRCRKMASSTSNAMGRRIRRSAVSSVETSSRCSRQTSESLACHARRPASATASGSHAMRRSTPAGG